MTELRALLQTDVVDAIQLSQLLGDHAMSQVWAAHDRAARDLLPRWRGREIQRSGGMLLLFGTSADAAGYAEEYHRALSTLPVPLQARVGLHFGAVTLRENSAQDVALGAKLLEVHGLAKVTVARVMSAAGAGQTLLTREARAGLLRTAVQLHSHGHWRIPGGADPVELFEVVEPGGHPLAPVDSEEICRVVEAGGWWLPARDIPNNLPHQGSSFIGRQSEIADLETRLGEARLVTLVGMGGVGKTRLALQVAAGQLHLYPDGVWFVDLSPLREAVLVVAECARVLEIPEEPGRPPLQTLCAHLKSRRALLVLDNCEHLIKPAAELADAILKSAPGVRVLASSREPLYVPGEHVFALLPLKVPDRDAPMDLLERLPAVQLFVERAQSHKPAFRLNERDASAVAELVARLEGIPLALELAAARVRSMAVADINKRLNERYRILTGGSKVSPERHQTLRALVDWSFELLNDNEQRVLRQAAVFAGGFGLEAAERVCGVPPIEDTEVLDLLSSLVEKSLVLLDTRGEEMRYRMLETLRDYAAQKLAVDGGEAAAVAVRHCDYYLQLAKDARDGLDGPEQEKSLRRLDMELDNIRAAMSLALAGGVDPVIAVKLAVAMQGFWIMRGYMTEGRRLVHAALDLPEVRRFNLATAHACYVGAALALNQGDSAEAIEMLESSLTIYRERNEPENIAAALSTIATARLELGDTEGATADATESIRIFRDLRNRPGEAISLSTLGQVAMLGDPEEARIQFKQGLALAREIESPELEGEFERLLGEVELEAGTAGAAGEHLSRSLRVCQEGGDHRGAAKALWRLGQLHLAEGDFVAACARLGEALVAFRSTDSWQDLLGSLEDYVSLAQRAGANEIAVRIAAAASVSRQRRRLLRRPAAERRWLSRLDSLRAEIGDLRFAEIWNDAQERWETADAVRAALGLDLDASGSTHQG